MAFYDSALDRLHEVHDNCEKSGSTIFDISRTSVDALTPDERHRMNSDFQIMQDEGWIIPYTPCAGTPYSFRLTAEGIRIAEERLYASIEEFAQLVNSHEDDSVAQQEILSVLKSILQKMDAKEPLEPGMLKELNSYLQGSSWLAAPLTSLVINYLSK